MIIDTSILIAIINQEPERETALTILENADNLKISAGTLMETTMIVLSRFGQPGLRELHIILEAAAISCVPTSQDHVRIIETAFEKFGKGQGNKAGLNYGDCFAYALAKEANETLLFKGDDFLHTDLKIIRLSE